MQRGTMQYYASLELPDGQTIPMTALSQDFGRSEFESKVPKEVSNIISRRQFQISFSTRDKKFYIEDLGSTNGTIVNGNDIRGKGKVPLNSGDVISPADVINLKFKG
jgi:pSer/pThr/pTyr-binding forkhead associated (FHA) protein